MEARHVRTPRGLETFSTSVNIVGLLWGRVAQLGERVVRNDEAAGSIPATSTIFCPQRRHQHDKYSPNVRLAHVKSLI